MVGNHSLGRQGKRLHLEKVEAGRRDYDQPFIRCKEDSTWEPARAQLMNLFATREENAEHFIMQRLDGLGGLLSEGSPGEFPLKTPRFCKCK